MLLRRLAAPFAALCALALTSCVPGGPSAEPRAPAPKAWDRASSADSIAAWARGGCRGLLGTDARCVEKGLLSVLETAGVAKAMAALDLLVEQDGAIRREAHGLAHGLGINAYKSPETVGETFAACPPTQMSGCYHGVIQGYFLAVQRDSGTLSDAALNALCEEQRASPFLFFQCAHGLGHGLMALHGHHLPSALEGCDRATDAMVRESCYGGVFMENIVSFTHPHHTAEAHSAGGHGDHGASHPATASADSAHTGHGAHAGHGGAAAADEHAGHGEGQMAAAEKKPWKALDPSEPLYPCTVVASKYHHACYMNQSSAVLYMTLANVGAVARHCARAPGQMAAVCYRSLGRDVTALAERDHARSLELCARAGAGEAECITGVAENLVNLAADVDEGMRFCKAVEDADKRGACWQGVGRMLQGLEPSPARREALCATVDAPHVQRCRSAAALPPAATTETK